MKITPAAWPGISPSISYEKVVDAIDWLCRAFGFEVELQVEREGGRIEYAALTFDDGFVVVTDADSVGPPRASLHTSLQRLRGVNTLCLFVYTDDVETHLTRARAAGATIVAEPMTIDYGDECWIDRSYKCVDPGGYHWWFAERARDPDAPRT